MMIPGEKPEGTVFEPSNTVPLGPWSMYKNVLAEYNLKQRWFLIDFLSYISYIIFSDQIAETWEACDRGRVPRPLSFFIWNILQRGTYEQKYFRLYLKLFYFLRFLRTIQPIHPIKQNHNWHVYYNHKKRNFHTKFFHRPGGYTSHIPASSL